MIEILISYIRNIKNYYFPNKNPFGKRILASKEDYLSIFNEAKNIKYTDIDKLENENGFKVEKNWLDELALHTQVVIKESPINYQHGRVLYSELRKYIQNDNIKNINILEVGTARGFSSICMSKAINDDAKINGKINTIDIISNDQKIYWNCIDDLESKKTRKELLKSWQKELNNISFFTGPSAFVLKKIRFNRIHFAYIDGMHDYFSTKKEFTYISNKQLIGDLIIFDDYSNSFPGIIKLIDQIKNNKSYEITIISSSKDRAYAIAKKII